jgi:hypothetical protein
MNKLELVEKITLEQQTKTLLAHILALHHLQLNWCCAP